MIAIGVWRRGRKLKPALTLPSPIRMGEGFRSLIALNPNDRIDRPKPMAELLYAADLPALKATRISVTPEASEKISRRLSAVKRSDTSGTIPLKNFTPEAVAEFPPITALIWISSKVFDNRLGFRPHWRAGARPSPSREGLTSKDF